MSEAVKVNETDLDLFDEVMEQNLDSAEVRTGGNGGGDPRMEIQGEFEAEILGWRQAISKNQQIPLIEIEYSIVGGADGDQHMGAECSHTFFLPTQKESTRDEVNWNQFRTFLTVNGIKGTNKEEVREGLDSLVGARTKVKHTTSADGAYLRVYWNGTVES